MMVKKLVLVAIGLLVFVREPQRRNERGLSQSAESAILLAGAVAIAIVVVTLITAFVRAKLAEI